MEDLIEGLDPNTVTMLLIGLFVVACALAVVFVFVTRDKREMHERIERIASNRKRADKKPKRGAKAAALQLRKRDSQIKLLDMFVKALPNTDSLRLRLARTGKDMSLGGYVIFMGISAVIGAFLAMQFIGLPLGGAILAGILIGIVFPHLVVGFMIGRRKKRFVKNFPDAIDVLVRGLKAGLPAAESMRIIAKEMQGPVSQEFGRITDGLTLGRELDDLLWEAAKRINLTEYEFFAITLSINRETGGNLSETLENLSEMLRKRRAVGQKVKAMSSEAKASSYIIGSLPFLMFGALYFLNENYVMTLIRDPRGWYMLGFGAGMMMFGIGVMAKMIKFEI
jgi:tight adherence protein B